MELGHRGGDVVTKSVVIARPAGVTVLNPLLYSDLATGEVVNRIFDHLVLTDDRQRYVPGRLVTSWRSSPDGLTWDFFLRESARWHDGRPVTADDAVFTFETILDPATGSVRRSEFLVGDEPLRFEARGPHQLRVVAPEPFAPLLAGFAWRPLLPRHIYAGRPLADHPGNERPVGSGAFRVLSRTPEQVVLGAEARYHLGRPPLDEVEWRRIGDLDAAVADLVAGTADYVPGVTVGLAAELADRPDLRLVRSADTSFTYLGFNLDVEPFTDLRVRQAIAAAIDREALVADVLGGNGRVAQGPIAPGSPWHHPGLVGRAYDPADAGRLLEAAGWARGPDGRRRRDGRRLRFTIRTVAGDRLKELTAARVAADLARVGIGAEVVAQPMARLLPEHIYPRRYEAALLALVPNPDPAFLRFFYHSAMLTPVGWNRFGYANRRVDALLDASQSEMDQSARAALVRAAQENIVRELPQVFLFHPEVLDAARSDIVLPALPTHAANRFMYLHEWDRKTD